MIVKIDDRSKSWNKDKLSLDSWYLNLDTLLAYFEKSGGIVDFHLSFSDVFNQNRM